MKLKNLFLAGLALVCMTACSNDDDPQATPNENVNAYMQISIVGTDGNVSRAGKIGTDDGDPNLNESTISNLKVLLCGEKDAKVRYAYRVETGDIKVSQNGFTTSPIAATKGKFSVYVIANCPEGLITPEPENGGTDLDTLKINEITQVKMQTVYAANKNFIMFNESLGKEFFKSEDNKYKVAQIIEIGDDNNFTNPAKLTAPIKLDRLAVKIVSESTVGRSSVEGLNKSAGFEDVISSVKFEGYKLLNGAKRTNLCQKWVFNYEDSELGSRNNTLITPNITVNTAYYNNLSDFVTIYLKESDDQSKNILDKFENIAYYTNESKNLSTTSGPIYCMENNPSYDGTTGVQALNGNATGLIYLYTATLKQEKLPTERKQSGSEVNLGENTFFWYNGSYYLSLAAIQDAFPTVFDTAEGKDSKAKLATAIKELSAAMGQKKEARQNAISAFRVKYNVKVYDEGKMYYTYVITDKNYTQLKNGKKDNSEGNVEYVPSVLRNNIYSLNVTKLNAIGFDIPGGWNPGSDPNDPVNPTNVYMQVTVSVNPWILQSEDITLG